MGTMPLQPSDPDVVAGMRETRIAVTQKLEEAVLQKRAFTALSPSTPPHTMPTLCLSTLKLTACMRDDKCPFEHNLAKAEAMSVEERAASITTILDGLRVKRGKMGEAAPIK